MRDSLASMGVSVLSGGMFRTRDTLNSACWPIERRNATCRTCLVIIFLPVLCVLTAPPASFTSCFYRIPVKPTPRPLSRAHLLLPPLIHPSQLFQHCWRPQPSSRVLSTSSPTMETSSSSGIMLVLQSSNSECVIKIGVLFEGELIEIS